MSNLYAIKEDTLTALGDAVRSKALGTSELPVLNVENEYIPYSKAFPYSLPGYVKKVKLTGVIDFSPFMGSGNIAGVSGTQGLGVASGNFGPYDHRLIRQDDSYEVLFEGYGSNVEMPSKIIEFETIVEGNRWAFVVTVDSSSPKEFFLTFTAVGLDENGNEFKYTPLEMVDRINGLDTILTEALTITGDCSYRFAYDGWNWLINQFGDKITTKNITNAFSMFYYASSLKEIPFDININTSPTSFSSMFYADYKLKSVPYIIGPERTPPASSYSGCLTINQMFYGCNNIRNIPYDYFWKIVPNKDFWDKCATTTTQNSSNLFSGCYSLREYPDISMLRGVWTSSYSNVYSGLFERCYSLDKIENLPVLNNVNVTSNFFNNTFSNCNRVKEIIFETNEDGTPKTANWKSQTIDLTSGVGNANGTQNYILNYNSGITADKEAKDDATYQALKNDPDWYATLHNYSRYNHDSAVNTINSLPDCSAFGTNTIKFKGAAGTLTDGGAINTLTEEEIAVAAARGWTVTLS